MKIAPGWPLSMMRLAAVSHAEVVRFAPRRGGARHFREKTHQNA
jgi:hypothetical protein